jgi:AcrR family transcriptional regulator
MPGRPLSAELSEQLLSVAVDILAEEGWGRLNSDRIAARARAGKAGIYRRWPSMAALTRHALDRFSLVSPPRDGGSLRKDLLALAARWTRPLDREERAVASIVGAAVTEIGARAAGRGEPVEPSRLTLLGLVIEAFWWQRYTTTGDGAMSQKQVESVVDDVLLPIVQPAAEAVRGEPVRV